jgi:hypothetical protein
MLELTSFAKDRFLSWMGGVAKSPVITCHEVEELLGTQDLDVLTNATWSTLGRDSIGPCDLPYLIEYGPGEWWAAVYYNSSTTGMIAHAELFRAVADHIQDTKKVGMSWEAIADSYLERAGLLRSWVAGLRRDPGAGA